MKTSHLLGLACALSLPLRPTVGALVLSLLASLASLPVQAIQVGTHLYSETTRMEMQRHHCNGLRLDGLLTGDTNDI